MNHSFIKFIGIAILCLLTGAGATTVYFKGLISQQKKTIAILQTQLEDKPKPPNYSTPIQDRLPQQTISPNGLAEDNASLKLTISKLAKALAKTDQQLKQQQAENKNESDTPQEVIARQISQSPEFIKSTLVPLQIRPVVDELTTKLGLSTEVSERLTDLLQAKAEADVDASMPYMQKIGDTHSQSDMNNVIAQVDSELNKNQQDYKNELEKFLNEEQLDGYREFEKEKFQQQQQVAVDYRSNEFNMVVGDLNAYQQQEIKSLFQENSHIGNSDINLGVSGSPFSRHAQLGSQKQIITQQKLEYLLTEEQLRKYTVYLESKK
ncbi:MAG: hypothetical protein JKX81_08770 [Arenicella sp.]|nr:hypothetical protein [Arenicella sp.]